jgi:hypothetical protein
MAYWRVAKIAAKAGRITPNGMIAGDLYQQIEHDLIRPSIQFAAKSIKAGELPPEAGAETISKILRFQHWVPLIGQYEMCGRQIFDLHDKLTELLSHTDVGDATIEDLHTPYDAFFLRFGLLPNIRMIFDETRWEYLDGAFVGWAPFDLEGQKGRRLKIGFTTVHEDGTGVGYPGFVFDIRPNELKLSVPDAIDTAMRRRLSNFEDQPGQSDSTQAVNAAARYEIEEAAGVLRDASALLINSLFYLESIRDHLPTASPGRDVPPDRIAKWMQAPPVKRHKLASSLTADGFAVVRLIGQEVADHALPSPPGSGTVRMHWRRGHWRMQPYGEHRSLRKRIWIKPMLVGGDEATPEERDALKTHLYIASNPPNAVQ